MIRRNATTKTKHYW